MRVSIASAPKMAYEYINRAKFPIKPPSFAYISVSSPVRWVYKSETTLKNKSTRRQLHRHSALIKSRFYNRSVMWQSNHSSNFKTMRVRWIQLHWHGQWIFPQRKFGAAECPVFSHGPQLWQHLIPHLITLSCMYAGTRMVDHLNSTVELHCTNYCSDSAFLWCTLKTSVKPSSNSVLPIFSPGKTTACFLDLVTVWGGYYFESRKTFV